ncbi:MAG TPA: NUDIX domain-containing protein [Longimicrobiales bacterium]|nr:NUDIX domain-containing protein [Longimicrobiales bacterium]
MTTKRSVALAIQPPARSAGVLLVQRPSDDEDLPNVWGLPAASLLPGETWEDAVRRAAHDKLGVDVTVGPLLLEGTRARPGYELAMRLYAAAITAGEPAVPQPHDGVTQYQAWRWGSASDLQPAADAGSLCSQLYLRAARR